VNEKKQLYNNYRVQKKKEEAEQEQEKLRKNKEEVTIFLEEHELVSSDTRYSRACKLIEANETVNTAWQSLATHDRRGVYDDVCRKLREKEQELEREIRERCRVKFSALVESMPSIIFKTTWREAMKLVEANPVYSKDDELLSMDKEDMLVVFEDHIRALERVEDDKRLKEREKERRAHRKNRDGFQDLLRELHSSGKLSVVSLWKDLYPTISADQRYHDILGQPGSSPLDLFKFHIEELKIRHHDQKKIMKDILKDASFVVEVSTPYEEFQKQLLLDSRSNACDLENMKLVYENLKEKAIAREKELQRAEEKKAKKRESNFRQLLKSFEPPFTEDSSWEQAREKLKSDPSFEAITEEVERVRIFKDYLKTIKPLEQEHKHKSHKKKKKYKRSSRSRSRSPSYSSGSEGEVRDDEERSRRKRRSPSRSSGDSDYDRKKSRKHKKKKSKKRRSATPESDNERKRERKRRHGREHKEERSKRKKEDSPGHRSPGEISDED
jgi:pre-mRNA-processing factor 40